VTPTPTPTDKWKCVYVPTEFYYGYCIDNVWRRARRKECVPCGQGDWDARHGRWKIPGQCVSRAECKRDCPYDELISDGVACVPGASATILPSTGEGGQPVSAMPEAQIGQSTAVSPVAPQGFGFKSSGGFAAKCACDSGFGWQKQGEHPCGCLPVSGAVKGGGNGPTLFSGGAPRSTGSLVSAARVGPCATDCCCLNDICLESVAPPFPAGPGHQQLSISVIAKMTSLPLPALVGPFVGCPYPDLYEYDAGLSQLITGSAPAYYSSWSNSQWNHYESTGAHYQNIKDNWDWAMKALSLAKKIEEPINDNISIGNPMEFVQWWHLRSGCPAGMGCLECCLLTLVSNMMGANVTIRFKMLCGPAGTCVRPREYGVGPHGALGQFAPIQIFDRWNPAKAKVGNGLLQGWPRVCYSGQ